MSAFLCLGKTTAFSSLWVACFQCPWTYQVSYAFLPPTLVPLVLSKFLAEHVTGQFRLLILKSPCWMEVPQHPTALNMLEDPPHLSPMVKDLIIDVILGQVPKDLLSLHLILWLLKDCVV